MIYVESSTHGWDQDLLGFISIYIRCSDPVDWFSMKINYPEDFVSVQVKAYYFPLGVGIINSLY